MTEEMLRFIKDRLERRAREWNGSTMPNGPAIRTALLEVADAIEAALPTDTL